MGLQRDAASDDGRQDGDTATATGQDTQPDGSAGTTEGQDGLASGQNPMMLEQSRRSGPAGRGYPPMTKRLADLTETMEFRAILELTTEGWFPLTVPQEKRAVFQVTQHQNRNTWRER